MSSPNLITLSGITARTAILDLSSTEQDLIAAVTATHVYLVDAIMVANVSTTSTTGEITVFLKRSGSDRTLCYKVRMPPKTLPTNVLPGKSLTLEDGDSLRVIGGPGSPATGILTVYACYSDCAP